MISTGELAAVRADAAAFLPDVCTVERPGASVSDGAGGWSSPFDPVVGLTAVPCRLAPRSQDERRDEEGAAGRITADGDWIVTFAGSADVRNADRVVVTVGAQAPRTFEVLGVDGPRSYEVVRRAACAEVAP